MSDPKRPVPEPSNSLWAPNTSVTPKETGRVAAATPPAPPGAAAGLYVGRSAAQAARASRPVQQEPWRRKRKEMEAEIQMDELESIMSEDMDCFDEPPSDEGQQAQPTKHSSAEKKRADVVPFSASKKQRVALEENGTGKRPQGDLGKESASITSSRITEQHIVSVKTEKVHPSEYGSSKPPEASWDAVKVNPLGEDEASFVEVRTNRLSVRLCPFGHAAILRKSHLLMFRCYCTVFLLSTHLGCRASPSRNEPPRRTDEDAAKTCYGQAGGPSKS